MVGPKDTQKGAASTTQSDASATPSAMRNVQSGQLAQTVGGRGGPTESDREEAQSKVGQQSRAGGVDSNQKEGEEVDDSREYARRWFDEDTDLAIPMDETTGEPYKPGEVPPGWNRPIGGEYRGVLKDKMDCDAEYAETVAKEARDKAIDERERLSNAASERIKREAEETDPAKKGTKESDEPPTMEGGGKKGGEAKDAKVGSDFKTAKK